MSQTGNILEGQAVFNKLTSPRAVKAAISECNRLGRDQFLREYGFERSREYFLIEDKSEYDSKAIAAVALGYQYGMNPPRADQCTGGKDYGHAGWALNRLGFQVTGIRHIGWWLHEVEPVVDAYLEMQVLVAAKSPFHKSDFLKALHEHNPSRSYKAHEYKLQNVSAVMQKLGRPMLPGYAPLAQFQELLRFVVEDKLGLHSSERPNVAPASSQRLSKVDWAKRDAENRALGRGGEQYIFEQERLKLIDAQRADLAKRVRWLADEADGHGYDIESFDTDGNPIKIEVKTTSRGKTTPFFVSANEVKVSSQHPTQYRLYRVYDFLSTPQYIVISGPISETCNLMAASYSAAIKP